MLGRVRIWCTNDDFPNGKMYYPEEGKFMLSQNLNVFEIYQNALIPAKIRNDDVCIMFSFGTKDFKRTRKYPFGQDVYTGDIIKTFKDTIHIISFENNRLQADDFYYSGNDDPTDIFESRHNYFEVIGNIYKTPDLIELIGTRG